MTAIVDIIGREILDSRGNPTVEVDVVLEDGSRGRAGGAVGRFDRGARGGRTARRRQEALSRQGRAQRGRGGQRRDLRRALRHGRRGAGQDRRDHDRARRHAQQGRLGANAILGVSLAVAKAAAAANKLPLYRYVGGTSARLLPVPMMNIVNGGVHADNPIDFQEFMIVPLGAASLCGGVARRLGNLSHAARGAQSRRPQHQCGRRGRLCAQSAVGRSRARFRPGGHRKGRLPRRRRRHARARSGGERVLQGRRLSLRRRGQDALDRAAGRVSRRARQALSDRVDRRRHGRGRFRRLEEADAKDRRPLPACRRRYFRHQRGAACRTASRTASAIRS